MAVQSREKSSKEESFTTRIKKIIKQIPKGKVATYSQIATLAGNYRAPRQVVWILHSSSIKDRLPWHRVINSQGKISLPPGNGFEEQKQLLEKEGVKFNQYQAIDLELFLWNPGENHF